MDHPEFSFLWTTSHKLKIFSYFLDFFLDFYLLSRCLNGFFYFFFKFQSLKFYSILIFLILPFLIISCVRYSIKTLNLWDRCLILWNFLSRIPALSCFASELRHTCTVSTSCSGENSVLSSIHGKELERFLNVSSCHRNMKINSYWMKIKLYIYTETL